MSQELSSADQPQQPLQDGEGQGPLRGMLMDAARFLWLCAASAAFLMALIKSGVEAASIAAVLSNPAVAKASLLAYPVYMLGKVFADALDSSMDGQQLPKKFSSIWAPLKMVVPVVFLIPATPAGLNAAQLLMLYILGAVI